MTSFRVGITRDFLGLQGPNGLDGIGLDVLNEDPRIAWDVLPEDCTAIPGEVARQFDALLVLAPKVTAETVDGNQRLAVVARFGVGYDSVDVEACTRNGVLLTITPNAVRRPVAVSALTLILALASRLLIKDRLTRVGRWHEKLSHMGVGLTGRTLGVIGLGNIGREVFRLAEPFEMRHVAFDPFASAMDGVALVGLEELLRQSDFVCICCALTPETHHLINIERLRWMKPTSFLVNVARGPIVDQAALTLCLQQQRIAGAGLDVFETEPVDPNDPLLKLENVIVSPHALCWTDELFRGNGEAACRSIVDVAAGRVPQHVVNREAIGLASVTAKLRRFARR